MRSVGLIFLVVVFVCRLVAPAQEEETPPPKAPGVRITFLPPPIKGTLSLGIYNKAGKLVRVLHREATEKDFTIGLNGLITAWDGKDDAGATVAPGKYLARGYGVGTLEVEGVAYHCNDFMVDEDSIRIQRILALRSASDARLVMSAALADGRVVELEITEDGRVKLLADAEARGSAPVQTAVSEGEIVVNGKTLRAGSLPDLQKPVDAVQGREGTLWVIDQTSSGVEVKQYSAGGEFLRRLPAEPEGPAPQKIAASTTQDRIYLLEQARGVQRVRGLARDDGVPLTKLGDTATNLSTWKTFLSKQIVTSKEFAIVADKLGRSQPFKPEPQITVRTLPNPLFKNSPASISLEISHDAEGSVLRTVDALPLLGLTDTTNLKWSVMGRENGSRAITIFQSDGSVVEEFRLRKIANIMAFDAGEYEWSGK